MSDSNQLTKSWKLGWVLLIIAAALLSSRMGYMAPLVLPITYSIAQSISIAFIPNARYPIIWLAHIPYWLIVLSFGLTENVILTGLLGSSVLGEILLPIIVKNAKRWKWLLYHTCAMIVLFLVNYFISSIEASYFNDVTVLVAIGVMFGLSALVSVMGIELKSPETDHEKRSPLESDDL